MSITNTPMDIITRLNGGDTTAFDEIYRQFHKPLVYFATRVTDNKEEAEDIVQITFLKLWEKRGDYTTPEKLKAFLYIITRNRCLDYLKQRKAQATDHQTIKYLSQKEEEIENQIIKADVLRHVQAHVESLPEKQREVFKMFYWENKTVVEIKETLNISSGNVRTLKSMAVKNVRIFLENSNLLTWMIALLLPCFFCS